MTNSMTRYETVFESTKNLPRFIEIGHGENADLYTSITDCGVPVSLSGYTVSALYQPSSKWETTEYYSCPLEVVGDTVIIHWSHLQDNGDNGVKMWVSFSKGSELAYPALYKIGLFQTPGFEPSPITPIPETLDFSLYNLVNAPWALSSDFNTLSENVATLSTMVEDIPYNLRTEYLTASTFTIFNANSNEVLGIYVLNNASKQVNVSLPIPTEGKATDLYVDVYNYGQNIFPTKLQILSPYWQDPSSLENLGWDIRPAEGEGELSNLCSIPAGKLARFHIMQSGTPYTRNPLALVSRPFYNQNKLSANVSTLSGTVETLSGNVNTLSGTVETLSGNVNTLSNEVDEYVHDKYFKSINACVGEIELSPECGVYAIAAEPTVPNGTSYTFPTPDATGIPDGDMKYYDYELEVYVEPDATTITGPTSSDGWTWMDGGELPTDASDFAGKTIYIACRLECLTKTMTLANVWRIA